MLHIASDSKEKRFEVVPSDYVVDYISNNIKDEFVHREVQKAIKTGEKQEYVRKALLPHAETSEEPCPVCNGRIAYIEGCNCCIECGWSSCVSG